MALTFISANDYANQISNETIHNGSYWRISNLWHKGDFSLLYAEDRKEATAAAFAMAANVSPGLAKTLFVSFPQNLRDIQPQLRGNENVQIFIPTANLEEDFSETLIDNLRTAIKDHGFDTIVIDNLNRISALSTGRNAALTQLVNSLFALHVETDATLLITAYNLSKSTRFRLAALTDTTFSAETVQEEGIYRTQKSCILTNALRPDNLASQNNLINNDSRGGWKTSRQHQRCEFQVSCSNNSTNNNPSDSPQSKLVGTRIFASAPADTSASSNNNPSNLSEPSDSSDFHQSNNNDSRGGWKSSRYHQQSDYAGDNSPDSQLRSNHRLRQCESRDAGEASRRSWGTVSEAKPREVSSTIKSLPRWQRRRLQRANNKL